MIEFKTELTFDITINDDDTIIITPSRSFTVDEFIDEFIHEALFWEDMSFYQSHMDGWSYIHNQHNDKVYPTNDYHYDLIKDLMSGKSITLIPHDNDETYAEYEWNDGE